ncbi:DNA polymerase III subunit alpha [Alicyclobacillus fodiniaquatilis]|uniref:DNA-directed DNA polymerase n=1 Tax=Alicyclobacillus fodiniaquatilis TaxID=1661150 RepID=A0ABW4JJW4_9BACL
MHDFVHLHVHSAYSLRESTLRLEEMIADVATYEMSAVALTDTNAMYGVVPFYQAAKRAGVQPLIGVQFDVQLEAVDPSAMRMRGKLAEGMDRAVVIARNLDGYRTLTKLVTQARQRHVQPFITLDELAVGASDVICLVGGGESLLLRQFAAAEMEQAALHLTRWANACAQGQLYVDVQQHQLPLEQSGLPRLLETAKQLDIPLVATNDVHYRRNEDAALQRAYAKLEFTDADARWPNDQFAFVSGEEMAARFAQLPAAIENTAAIADMCNFEFPPFQVRMPIYPTKDGRAPDVVLREAATAGAKQRFGEQLPEHVAARLQTELDIICEMGYADYFLVVADFIRFAHQAGISTGPGRGSAAGSVVAYALRITDVDPVANQLLFERFLNPARVSLPDIDTDFEYERRGEVIAYVVQKYGVAHVAQIGTFGTLAARAAVRDAGRMLQADGALIDKLAKMIPGVPGMTLAKAREEVRGMNSWLGTDAAAKQLFDTASALEGLPHHTSTHAAGVVISPDKLTDWLPLEQGADNIPVTQYPMADVEALGLVKMDFLGLRKLTLMDNCMQSVKARQGQQIDWRAVPENDAKTLQMLTRGETNGVFQLESPGMRRVLRQVQPTTLDDIVAVISLNRPGPMENIPLFADTKHGKTPLRFPHPDLAPILRDTYGVIVYQEQIMQIASRMAGFTLGEADLLRRAVSKKKREILAQERERFVRGCVTRGYEEQVANDVYDLIVRFADYGFPRSHAVAYAVLAYRTAYLRAHYLADFLAALMTMAMASTDKIRTYTEDAKRHQIVVRPACVQQSQRGYSVDADGQIRTGLLAIRNVGEGAVESIIEAREAQAFTSLRDFLERVNTRVVNRKAVDSLLAAGALDSFFPERVSAHAKAQMLEEAQRLADENRQFAGLGLLLDTSGKTAVQAARQEVLYIRYHQAGAGDKQTLKRIEQVLSSSPGRVSVALYDGATRRIRLLGDKWNVTLSPEVMTLLEDIVGIGNVKVGVKQPV